MDPYSILLLKTGVFLWLFIWTIIDICYPLRLRCFFVSPLDVISRQQDKFRVIKDKGAKSCPAFELYKIYNGNKKTSDETKVVPPEIQTVLNDEGHKKCPVFFNLEEYLSHVKSHPKDICSQIKDINDMWNIIRRACVIRYQQVAFLELLIIQIFLIVFWPNIIKPAPQSSTILYLDYFFIIGIIILFAVFLISHVETKPFAFYENKKYRLILILGSWFVIFLYLINYSS